MSDENSTTTRIERVLAYATLSIIALAVVAYVTTIIVGMNDREALVGGLWPLVTWIAYVGLPIGFVLLVTLLIINLRRRSRENAVETRGKSGRGRSNGRGSAKSKGRR